MFKKLFFEILISEQKQEKLLEFPMNNSLCGNEKKQCLITCPQNLLLIDIVILFRPLKEENEIKKTHFFWSFYSVKEKSKKSLLLKIVL